MKSRSKAPGPRTIPIPPVPPPSRSPTATDYRSWQQMMHPQVMRPQSEENNVRKHLAACLVIEAALGTTIAVLAQAPATPASAAKKGAPAGLFGRGAPPPSGPTPHLPDGTVDLSGVWNGGGSNSGDISK